MPVFKAPLRDMRFILDDVFQATDLWARLPALADVVDRDTVDAILEEAGKFNEQVVFPLNRSGDEEGAVFSNGKVTTPAGFKEAFTQYGDGGWIGLGADPRWGGQGMPKMVTVMTEEIIFGANPSFALYPLLGIGAALAMSQHASDELNERYLPKIYTGEWAGTMCLTEPHAGTDLGIIKTKAVPQADGSYDITGTKIFITGGEHDLSSNIIHLVLAKLPDAPAGSKGISLFVVPKFLVNEDGSVGARNPVSAGSIEHKMGIKASATCVMNFDAAKGWLVGELNQGLAAMFVMMNYERLSMGLQGIGASEVAYQNAAAYAKDRLQGRSAKGATQPEKPADSILVHPDVRRMLLKVRAHNEAGRCFAMYVSKYLDLAKYSDDTEERAQAADRVALMTPVAKAFLTDKAFEACVDAQQVFGGHGYVREWGMEQLVRDTRIAQIYEGTNGVQAMDLVGRKLVKNRGAFVHGYLTEVRELIAQVQGDTGLSAMAQATADAADAIAQATDDLIAASAQNADEVNAAAVDFLHAFGLLCYAHMWLMMLQASQGKTDDFYADKRRVGAFFYSRMLPELEMRLALVRGGAAPLMALSAESF
ncbi:MAG: acyl-CoA dehydrogenase C-terminal domain-containing protein [Paraperlucidibaca sp.]|uniref:acyl-CoA dehydrogenase C-terminal domain-containing protein n=1 Tax=Paraperlucidibaca sp. TaxID=2708021 RepID=UPI001B617CED|nr:acyl-CoA dehydrogenase C-terminal domain-containing protein [Paraperlucidibaca sp.]MBQ0722536.1 acyl-CoA dehydrogenase C-terminal domain-containing protein [Paraperlucidibaca sp.]MBQ0842283.1 acyl-CoA dehydrogenase C-terminal domain-containing protein [Paraperlucidibaca sp.]